MEWNFLTKNKCELFVVHVSEPNPGDECFFTVVGDPVGDFVRVPNIPVIVDGTDAVYYVGFDEPWNADPVSSHICPYTNLKQTYPAGIARIVANENLIYVCLTALPPKKLDYDHFFGPHETYTTTHNNTFVVIGRGSAKFGDRVLNRWDIIKKANVGEIQLTEISNDAIIFYVWERQ